MKDKTKCKTVGLRIRMTKQELESVKLMAKNDGVSMSEFFRNLAMREQELREITQAVEKEDE